RSLARSYTAATKFPSLCGWARVEVTGPARPDPEAYSLPTPPPRARRPWPPHAAAPPRQGAEDTGRNIVRLDPVFRVPLDADGECPRMAHRDRLDRAVLRPRFDLERPPEPVDCLAMHGIDLDVAGAEHA